MGWLFTLPHGGYLHGREEGAAKALSPTTGGVSEAPNRQGDPIARGRLDAVTGVAPDGGILVRPTRQVDERLHCVIASLIHLALDVLPYGPTAHVQAMTLGDDVDQGRCVGW